ncbi:E3 ubiquitin-protein ligase rad18 [Myotisia sp. PD_48]|nr:E3 ubiquitin-protein ligase rad18 [Myotisia sp. PD_48]
MDLTIELSDSTDWLDTPLAGLSRVETALRCQICKDIFKSPVITSCSHTFCSLCIRRCLSTDGKCPVCRRDDQALKLRQNWAVEEFVESFQAVRASALEVAQRSAQHTVEPALDNADGQLYKRRKLDSSGTTDSGRLTRSRTRNSRASETPPEPVVIGDDEIEEGIVEPHDGLVSCPICGKRMKNELVFVHLDNCTGEKPKTSSTFGSLVHLNSRDSSNPPQPLARMAAPNYAMFTEKRLRNKLKELGLPSGGTKPLLQRRHTEWVNLWNANCDSMNPKSKYTLLRELDTWERAQGGGAVNQQSSGAASSVMRKDFDGKAWSITHGENYRMLIENARQKPAVKPAIEDGDRAISMMDKTGSPEALQRSPTPPTDTLEPETHPHWNHTSYC